MASRILRELVIDKIAAVDRPCQEHATVAIMKRHVSEDGVSKVDLTALGDQITKGIFFSTSPTSVPSYSEDDDTEDFSEALSEVVAQSLDWKLESAISDVVSPLIDALRRSLCSICKDMVLDPTTKLLAIRNSVGQFLTALQEQYPQIPQKVADAMTKRAATEAAQRGLLKLKLNLMSAQVEKANGMLIEGYGTGGGRMPKSKKPSRNSQPITKK